MFITRRESNLQILKNPIKLAQQYMQYNDAIKLILQNANQHKSASLAEQHTFVPE
jgi:hypothetical protein